MSEIGVITMEKISDKCYNVEIDFGEGMLLQIGVDNTEGDIDVTLLDRVMEALQRSYKLSFKDMYLVRCIIKGLLRRVQ